MKYLPIVLVLFLSGCAAQMIGVNRETGERITIHYQDHLVYEELTTTIDGETFTGKLVPASAIYAGEKEGAVVTSYRSVLIGNKNRTARCEIGGNGYFGGGAGSCITSDGKTFDVTW